MKQIILFLSLFFSLFASDELKNIFGQNYHSLDIEKKRQIFFVKMNEMFERSFENIARERAFIEVFFQDAYKNALRNSNQRNIEKLVDLKNKYRIKNLYDMIEYKKRIQKIPKSMGMAQALIESATATSRFAREANNLFGELTWGKKGLIPSSREPNKRHRIRIFNTLQDSVDSYVLNLNRHFAYEDFRKQRYEFYNCNREITGLQAIQTLSSYSQGSDYIDLVTRIIKQYDLEKYDFSFTLKTK